MVPRLGTPAPLLPLPLERFLAQKTNGFGRDRQLFFVIGRIFGKKATCPAQQSLLAMIQQGLTSCLNLDDAGYKRAIFLVEYDNVGNGTRLVV